MAGDEEARARAALVDMQTRIAEGPTSALGIGEVVTPEDVRTAFLGLTKQFHPARFGRLPVELQKLSNEVFLGIKAAHDHMLKVLGSSAASVRGGARPSTQAIPIAQGAEGTSRTAALRVTQSIPRIEGTMPPPSGHDGRASSPVMGSRSTPPMGVPVQQRPTTGSLPVRRTGAFPIQTPVPSGTQPGIGGQVPPPRDPPPSSGNQPLSRPITPVPPGTQPGIGTTGSGRMVRGSSGQSTPPPSRTMTPMVAGRPFTPPSEGQNQPPRPTGVLTPPTQPPRPQADSFNPPTVRNVPMPPPGRTDDFDEAAAFRDAAALMEQKNWQAARLALHALAARVPQSKHYRAWLCYARGREAYLAGRPEEAILEMQRALQLEPDLAHAKHALAELQRRR